MNADRVATLYESYIDCLNGQDWAALGAFVHMDVEHNDNKLGLSGYCEMLQADFRAIPDLRFAMRLVVVQPPYIASRLHFDCTPVGQLFGLPVNGNRVRFDENVFYEVRDERIRRVWSVIDKAAIAEQLQGPPLAGPCHHRPN